MPELSRTATGPIPLHLLIAHRAGLDAHRSLYLPLVSGDDVDEAEALAAAAEARREECAGEPPPDGFPPLYSDLGYLLAGAAAERAAGADLATLVAAEVTAPLGVDLASAAAWSLRGSDFFERVAPTEVVAWRGGEVVGAVHDENAWALAGHGIAGNAGLFGTAEGVARFGAAFLDALSGRLPGVRWTLRARLTGGLVVRSSLVRPPGVYGNEPLVRSSRPGRCRDPDESREPQPREHRDSRGPPLPERCSLRHGGGAGGGSLAAADA